MIESVIYESMLKARRSAMHREVAHALEARWKGAEADHAETLAYHFSLAGEGTKALTYLVLAGERAAARYANEQAIDYFEQALRQLSEHVEASVETRWRLFTGLGDACRAAGRYRRSREALRQGLSLLESREVPPTGRASLYRRLAETCYKRGRLEAAEEPLNAALALLDTPEDDEARTEAARLHTVRAWVYFRQGQLEEAEQACTTAQSYAQETDAWIELAAAENLLGGICHRQGDWASALHHTMRAMTLREQMGYTWGAASSMGNLGVLAVSAGHWDRARSFFEHSLASRQEMGDVEGVVLTHNNMGTLARQRGNLDQARSHYTESLALARQFEMGFQVGNSAVGLARVLLMNGESEDIQELVTTAFSQAEATGAQDLLAEAHQVRAMLLADGSAWDQAKAEAERSAAVAADSSNPGLETAAWRVACQVELGRHDLEAAQEALRRAREALTDTADDLSIGRVAALAGRIALERGQVAEGHAELGEAKATFMRLGATRDLDEVRRTLGRRAESEVVLTS
jgi:tetratricopeptide (TPR) repeat protein